MNCQKCGKEIPNGSLFCNFCGARQTIDNVDKKEEDRKLQAPLIDTRKPPKPKMDKPLIDARKPPKPKMDKPLKITGLVILALTAIAVIGIFTEEPEAGATVFSEFMELLPGIIFLSAIGALFLVFAYLKRK